MNLQKQNKNNKFGNCHVCIGWLSMSTGHGMNCDDLHSLCTRFALALHALCTRFELALNSLCTRLALTSHSLCTSFFRRPSHSMSRGHGMYCDDLVCLEVMYVLWWLNMSWGHGVYIIIVCYLVCNVALIFCHQRNSSRHIYYILGIKN